MSAYASGYGRGRGFGQLERAAVYRDTPDGRRNTQYELDRLLRDRLRGVASYAVKNDPEAAAVVQRTQDLVVGPDGPAIAWDTGDAGLDRDLAREWEAFWHASGPMTADCTGLHDGPHLLRQAIDAWFVDGRFAAQIIGLGDGGNVTPQTGSVQLIEGRRLVNELGQSDDETHIAGLTLGEHGAVEAITVAPWKFGGSYLDFADTSTIDAGFVYLPNPHATEVGLIAPGPWILLATTTAMQQGQVIESVVQAVIKESDDAKFVRRELAGAELDDTAGDDDGRLGLVTGPDGKPMHRTDAAGLTYLAEGEDVIFGSSNYPQQALEPFLRMQLVRMGMMYGHPYEVLTGDYSKTNMSAAKFAQQVTGRTHGITARTLIASLVRPIIERAFIPSRQLMGLLPMDMSDAAYRPTITPPAMPEPDPGKAAVRRSTERKIGERLL
ncbi:MAG: phage portal protein, partial [Planctomycetota bacterium]